MVTDLDKFLIDNFRTKPKDFLESETGIKFYNLSYRAKKLGLHRKALCEYCGKTTYKQHLGAWMCNNCFYNVRGGRCVDCSKPIGSRNVRCYKCKYEFVAASNRIHEVNNCNYCGKKITPLNKTCGSKYCKQMHNIEKGRLHEHFCAVCNKRFLVSNYQEHNKANKFCSQKCYKEVYFPGFLKSRVFFFEKTQMRSSWEVKIAELFAKNGIEFEYEPRRIGGYIPDFYLPKYDQWVEVKGFMSHKSLAKIREFRKKGYKLYIINEKIYNRLISGEDIVQILNRFRSDLQQPRRQYRFNPF